MSPMKMNGFYTDDIVQLLARQFQHLQVATGRSLLAQSHMRNGAKQTRFLSHLYQRL